MQHLLDSSKQNPTALRYFIQYEVLQKKPIWESYKTFCQFVGDQTMGYPEFEFWYWRFYNGDVDVDYNRSVDRKPLELLKLPLEVVEKVTEKLELESRMTTRLVSKTVRSIVDNQKLKLKNIHLVNLHDKMQVTLHDTFVTYLKTYEHGGFTKLFENRINVRVVDQDLVTYTLNRLKEAMSHPKLELAFLGLQDDRNSFFVENSIEILGEVSATKQSKLQVKEVSIKTRRCDLLVYFLSLLKQGFLEKIEFRSIECHQEVFDGICNTEQWKMAKIAWVDRLGMMATVEIEKFRHFVEFRVSFSDMSAEIIKQMVETLFTFPNFKNCEIYTAVIFLSENIAAALEVRLQNQTIFVPIPGANNYLEITAWISTHTCIRVVKKTF